MSDSKTPPPADTPAQPAPEAGPRDDWQRKAPLAYTGALAILALAVIWLWARPAPVPPPGVAPARVAALEAQLGQVPAQLARLGTQLAAIDTRLGQLAARIDPLDQRIAAIEARPAPGEPPPPADLGPLESRLATALDRIAALEARPAPAPLPLDELASRKDLAALATRQDSVASRQDTLAARQQQAENEFATRLDGLEHNLDGRVAAAERSLDARIAALEGRMKAAEQVAARLPQVEGRTALVARIAAARAALEAGRPLGTLPDAPPELARFAIVAPPTEAALRLAFPAAARAAHTAGEPDTSGQGVLEAAWNRAQALVTVRRGEEVVVGDPAAGVLAVARRALDAGDLAGAVAALDRLPPKAAAAMADWLGQARALLAARAALARLAA